MPNRQTSRRSLVAAAAVVLASLGVAACGGTSKSSHRAWPDVKIADAAGAAMQSSGVLAKGRPSIIAIWGVTCAACRQELPRLQQLATSNTGVDIAAINYGDEPKAITEYLTSLGLDLRVFIDDEARLTEVLGVVSLPATIFVRADGTIDDLHLGELSASELEAGVDELLST